MTCESRRENPASRAMTALGALWLALFPLWQDGSYSRITRSKWLAMLLLTGVTLAVVLRVVGDAARRRQLKREICFGPLQWLALLLFGWITLSGCFGTWAESLNGSNELTVLWGAKRYEGLITQWSYGAIFLCMSLAPADLKKVLTAAGDALLAVCAVAALQYADINVLGLFPVGSSIRTNYEFQSTLGNIDMVSGYVSLAMPALLTGFAMAERGRLHWYVSGMAGVLLMLCMEVQSGLLAVGLMLLMLFVVFLRCPERRSRTLLVLAGVLVLASVRWLLGLPWLDGTEHVVFPFGLRAAKLLPAAAGMGLLGAAWLLRRRPGRALSVGAVVCIVLALALAALAVVYLAPLGQSGGLWELHELLHGRGQDGFGSERLGIWRLTLEMCRDDLLFGNGPDTFLYAMEDHMYQTDQTLVQRFDNPHNLLLGLLASSGVPAVAAFVLLMAAALALGVKRSRREPLLAALAAGVACYLLQGMFTFSLCIVSPMFWAAAGMLTAGCHTEGENRNDDDPELCVPSDGDEGHQAGAGCAGGGDADCDAAGDDQPHCVAADRLAAHGVPQTCGQPDHEHSGSAERQPVAGAD